MLEGLRHLLGVLAGGGALARPRVATAADGRQRTRGVADLLRVLLRFFGHLLQIFFARAAGERLLDLADVSCVLGRELLELLRGLVERLLDVAALALAFAARRTAAATGLAAGMRRPAATRSKRRIGLTEPRCEVLRCEHGMGQILAFSRAIDAHQIHVDDLAEVTTERAEPEHRATAAAEHDDRSVHALDAARLLRRLLRERAADREIVRDVGELLRHLARVLQALALDDGVDDENDALAGLHDGGMRGGAG